MGSQTWEGTDMQYDAKDTHVLAVSCIPKGWKEVLKYDSVRYGDKLWNPIVNTFGSATAMCIGDKISDKWCVIRKIPKAPRSGLSNVVKAGIRKKA